ncbi:hypothetical protein BDV18DRAFT_160129 [Aspergillus unguis]
MTFRTARALLQSKDAVKWRSKADGHERNLDAVEDFYFVHSSQSVRNGRRRLDLTVSVQIRPGLGVEIDIKQVRAAWIALRQKHPAIASTIHGSKRIYQNSPEDVESWVKRTFMDIPGNKVTPEVLDSLPAAEMAVLYMLEDNVYALRTPSHLMDMQGAVMVLNSFLDQLNKVLTGSPSDTGQLACSLKETAALPSASVSQLARLWNVRRRWLRNFPSVGVVPDTEDEYPVSGRASWRELRYSAASTKDLVNKARKHEMSVTHVVHAGVAHASKEYGPFTMTKNYTSVILMDMRRRIGIKEHAVSAQHAIWPINIPVTSYWETAELVKAAYEETVADPDLLALIEPTFAETCQTVLPSDCSVPVLASCGVIDNHLKSSYDSFTVNNFALATECSGDEGHVQ